MWSGSDASISIRLGALGQYRGTLVLWYGHGTVTFFVYTVNINTTINHNT